MSAISSRQTRQRKAMITMAAARQNTRACSKDRTGNSRSRGPLSRTGMPLLHMDECNDPNCADLESLQELQKSIDNFTDYEHYERCCDGDHADDEECNGNVVGCCQDSSQMSEDCEDCVEDCDECLEEHELTHQNVFDEILDMGTPVKCDDDCMKCEEECGENGHDRKDCPQDHHTSWDSCITTCGICVDPTPLPLLPGDGELQLYGLNNLMPHLTPCDERCTPPPPSEAEMTMDGVIQPQSNYDMALDHWQTFQQAHHCAPDPCTLEHLPQMLPPQHLDPQFGFSFGCDPMVPGNQYHWQQHTPLPQLCNVQAFNALDLNTIAANVNEFTPVNFSIPEQSTDPGQVLRSLTEQNESKKAIPRAVSPAPKNGKACQWLMPCGSICGQTFTRTEDLKKHVKNSHLAVKGTVTCRWGPSCTASFGSEAALTGHISKKHLAPLYAAGSTTASKADSKSPGATSEENQPEELPWKCTFPGCSKSFMYKQVRDDHVASHTGSNLAHCPICHRWLNAEGSNFRRHMASHKPEHEHMRCKHEHAGCEFLLYHDIAVLLTGHRPKAFPPT